MPNVIDERAEHPLRAAAGYDHPWYAWAPLPGRVPLSWPGERSLAVSVVIHLTASEWEENPGPGPRPPGGRGVGPFPDFPRMSHREFGHRVGVFRLLQALERIDVRPAVVIDVLTAERYPRLVDHLVAADPELVAGGLSASRPITGAMSEAEERDYIDETMSRLAAACGVRPRGWLGPEHSESARTPRLLAEAGLGYVADWGNDERPYPMTGEAEGLWAYPLSWELSDLNMMFLRQLTPSAYSSALLEASHVMAAGGPGHGRALGIHLHPWLTGQAFRAAALARALARIRRSPRVWFAPPGDVVDHCRRAG